MTETVEERIGLHFQGTFITATIFYTQTALIDAVDIYCDGIELNLTPDIRQAICRKLEVGE